jgi:hypothetical protein
MPRHSGSTERPSTGIRYDEEMPLDVGEESRDFDEFVSHIRGFLAIRVDGDEEVQRIIEGTFIRLLNPSL